jgi:hypothetical protein
MVTVEEQQFRLRDKQGARFRPFSFSADLSDSCYSRPLRRRVCDFGADHSFFEAGKKLKEHYGIDVPIDMIRKITEYNATEIKGMERKRSLYKEAPAQPVVIAEIDGSMIPLAEIDQEKLAEKKDRRKCRTLEYHEAKLSLAFKPGSRDRKYAGTLDGVKEAGKQLRSCVECIGMDNKTKVHCVGDGAPWIVEQVEEQFGANGKYLIDFYHLCEYLAPAAQICAPKDTSNWMDKQKARLKENCFEQVLNDLRPHIEVREGPVRDCYRYIDNRRNQLDYKTALEEKLPIGSGEIESAHRYVIQKRLKIAGAWWKASNAESMLALRTCRANDDWGRYWASVN